ncbi:MAG: methyltransferase domain-containing protein [Deltaproteobacteria bacterium]|nr:methyltransferase domain-containing protein [Deltaproteobacteria bacterium]
MIGRSGGRAESSGDADAPLAATAGALDGEAFKSCCADFYGDELVRRIIGDSFHPGGMALTRELLDQVGVTDGDRLLDVATGLGTSALLAAEERGCQVVGLDLSTENLERARTEAQRRDLDDRLQLQTADAERIPFPDESFDVVLCECAFCTFVDKPTAAAEMARVLRPGGRLALSDMTIDKTTFPADLDTLLMRVACIADALPAAKLTALFEASGFGGLTLHDASWGLKEMVDQIRQRLLAIDLLGRMGKLPLGNLDLTEGKRLTRRALEVIADGVVGYVTLTGTKPAHP